MATKYKNIVGSAFLPYVALQFEKRSSIVRKNPRTNSDLQFLTNRNAWFRLSSSASTTDLPEPTEETVDTSDIITGFFDQLDGRRDTNVIAQADANNKKALDDFNNSFVNDIAKNNVLQGGTIKVTGDKNEDTQLRKGFKETYQGGGEDDLGFKPMPGITGITVGTGGKWQTLMQADVEFICYDLDQLNIMSKLYMSLGVTCLLEWGHVPYVNNQGTIVNQNLPINFFKKDLTKNELLKEIQGKRKETDGNCDGFLGTVYNFSYQADKDGAYLCKVQLMGAGGMVESLKINTNFNMDFTNVQEKSSNDSEKYTNTLDNVLASLSEILTKGKIGTNLNKNTSAEAGDNTVKNMGRISLTNFFQELLPIKKGVNSIWGELLNKIYGECSYTPFTFSPTGETTNGSMDYNNSFSKFGNAHQIVSGIFPNPKLSDLSSSDDLPIVPLDFYGGYTCWYSGGFFDWKKDDDEIQPYITFGHLLALINSLGIFTESNTKKLNKKESTPILYIDYHPDNTEIKIGPIIASSNPYKCLVPFSRGSSTYNNFWDPLITNTTTNPGWFSSDKGTIAHNLEINSSSNVINKLYPESNFKTKDGTKGKLMNVLININFARETLRRTTDSEDNVNLIEYINKLLDGINESLGGINNLRTFIDECGNVLRIIDEQIPDMPLVKENLVTLPTFGTTSITYDASYNSAITPKLASQIVIATQASGGEGIKGFSEDVLSYQSLNGGVRDRFSSFKFPAISPTSQEEKNTAIEDAAKYQKSLSKLYDHFWQIYTFEDDLAPKNCSNLRSSYIDLSNKKSKITNNNDPKQNQKKGSVLIPLEYSIRIDGMSGILPYNAFQIPDNRLPERYRGKVAFAVFSINHSFENNNWFTTLRGQTIMLDTPTSIEKGVPPSPTLTLTNTNISINTNQISGGSAQTGTFANTTSLNSNNQYFNSSNSTNSNQPGEEDSPAGGIDIGKLILYPPTGDIKLDPERNDPGGSGNFGASRGVRNHKGVDIATDIPNTPSIDLLVYPNLLNAWIGLNPKTPPFTLKRQGLLTGQGTEVFAPITGKLRNSSIKSTSVLPGMAIDGTGEFTGYTAWIFYVAYNLSLVGKIVTKGTPIGYGVKLNLQPGYKNVGDHVHYQIAQKGVRIDPHNFKYSKT